MTEQPEDGLTRVTLIRCNPREGKALWRELAPAENTPEFCEVRPFIDAESLAEELDGRADAMDDAARKARGGAAHADHGHADGLREAARLVRERGDG